MTSHSHPVESLMLIFDWAARQDRRRRLILWILVALVLHGVALFLLRQIPPTPVKRDLSTAALFVLPASGPLHDGMLAVIESEDPTRFAPGILHESRIDPPQLPRFTPGFDLMEFRPTPLPNVTQRVLPPIDARIASSPSALESPPADTSGKTMRRPPPTRIEVTGGATPTMTQNTHQEITSIPAAPDVRPTRFLVAIDPDGRVRHVQLRQASGDEARDITLRNEILKWEFPADASQSSFRWAEVRVIWGSPEGLEP